MITVDDVRAIAQQLPGVTKRRSRRVGPGLVVPSGPCAIVKGDLAALDPG
jgi:hypothetical protein